MAQVVSYNIKTGVSTIQNVSLSYKDLSLAIDDLEVWEIVPRTGNTLYPETSWETERFRPTGFLMLKGQFFRPDGTRYVVFIDTTTWRQYATTFAGVMGWCNQTQSA